MTMSRVDEKVMFEIYREKAYDRRYRVVYFTELGDHDKEREISRAIAGSHVFDGFLDADQMEQARTAVDELLGRLNQGETPAAAGIDTSLSPFLVP
jgi:hypothetical protein